MCKSAKAVVQLIDITKTKRKDLRIEGKPKQIAVGQNLSYP